MWEKSVIFFCVVNFAVTQMNEGESCNDGQGTCLAAHHCDVAYSSIQSTGKHKLNRCGFSGRAEIVCCPNTENKFGTTSTTPRSRSQTRIAERECEKIVKKTIPSLEQYIIGGEVASEGEFPHMAALGYEIGFDGYKFQCGGTLLSDQYVLTAAHCIYNLERIKPTVVRLGVVELGGRQFNRDTDYMIDTITVHPDFKSNTKYHDLALIKIKGRVKLAGGTGVNAACLYTKPEVASNVDLIVTGWGITNTTVNTASDVLLKAKISLEPRARCSAYYTEQRKLPQLITEQQICAGDAQRLRDTCQGDSGGPLQGLTHSDGIFRLVGVTSFGRGCGSEAPGVYSRVYSYLDWIESVVWPDAE